MKKDNIGTPYAKITYLHVPTGYTETVEFSPDKPLQGSSNYIAKKTNVVAWFLVGFGLGGIVMYVIAKLAIASALR